jgi:hypothetical protein
MQPTVRTFKQIRESSQTDFVQSLTQELSERLRGFEISEQQMIAWQKSFEWIHDASTQLSQKSDDWLLLPEFSPPLSPIRPDVVIATGESTLIIEFKAGSSKINRTSRNQILGYAREMHGTMLGVRNSKIYAALVSPSIKITNESYALHEWKNDNQVLNEMQPKILQDVLKQLEFEGQDKKIELSNWMDATYELHPDIVRAASELVAHVKDRGIITHLSSDRELDDVRNEVLRLVNDARSQSKKRVILISGVPGAGKTLVGLRLAHDPDLYDSLPEDSGTPLYLTGNGPLVDVLVEAIARDDKGRNPERKLSEARHEAGSKVKLVHAITEHSLPINSHVVVFDEGQRVWSAEQMKSKGKAQSDMSEGEVILQILEGNGKLSRDWAALVVLIGSGQEINRGEAGASVWLEAVQKRNSIGKDWDIFCPLELASTGFTDVNNSTKLHLNVSRRARKASALSEWVGLVLDGKFSQAKQLRTNNLPLGQFPILVTRDIDSARKWIREEVSQGDQRFTPTCGFVASSKSARLRIYGLSVGSSPRDDEVNWTSWFLDDPVSLHASSRLEVAASEFKTQGLELDFVGVAWSWDLILNSNSEWVPRRIDKGSATWRLIKKDKQYLLNSYRVLLTRCREGMVIFIPPGASVDQSINPSEMDSVYAALIESGAVALD